jgi:polyisoprenoid-binding protein YceI
MLRKLPLLVLLTLFAVSAETLGQNRYTVDAGHSNVGFSIPILNGVSKVRGKFTDFTVNLDYSEADVAKSMISATIKAASIDTGIEARDKHLRNADFFDIEKYPEITFQSTHIEKKGKDFIAIGTLQCTESPRKLRFHSPPLALFENPTTKVKLLGFSGNLNLNRRDFGMNWKHSTIPNWVGDMVHIDLAVLVRSQAPR